MTQREHLPLLMNTSVVRFRSLDESRLINNYLYQCLRSEMFVNGLKSQATGSAQLNCGPTHIRKMKLPLPPLEVQREIVSEIEGYQRVIDGARAVVENWRPQIAVDPEWPVVRVRDVCTVNPKKSELNGFDPQTLVSFVPMADVREHTMQVQPHQERTIADVSASYSYFRDNDVLVARVTPCFENGKAGIATGLKNSIGFGSSEFHVLRSGGEVLPEWVYLSMMEPKFRELAIRNMTGTGGLQRVPKRFVEEYEIAVPSLEVQHDILAEFDNERAMVEGNRQLIERMEGKVRDVVGRVWGE